MSTESNARKPPEDLFAVTVTYGSRREYLQNTLQSLADEGVRHVVVVDNGACWDTEELLGDARALDVILVRLGSNKGSAVGFGRGIETALESGAETLLLLDDDNLVSPGSTITLVDALDAEQQCGAERSLLAVLGFRREHQAEIAAGATGRRAWGRRNSFRGFHVCDIPRKILRRLFPVPRQAYGRMPGRVLLQDAPYGGLLFHRALIDRVGLPDPRFVLYADDNEFTHRIIRQGGRVCLRTEAILLDQESSWNVKSRYANGFAAMLCGASEMRAYYSLRNGAYYDAYGRGYGGPVFWLNILVYALVLVAFSVIHRRLGRCRLLLSAIEGGLRGHLGGNGKFPL